MSEIILGLMLQLDKRYIVFILLDKVSSYLCSELTADSSFKLTVCSCHNCLAFILC